MAITFGKRLNELRKNRGLSQEELAKAVGIHTNVLGRYEREEAKPSIDIAISLADKLGVSLDYLVGKTDTELDIATLDKIVTIQKLPEEDKHCIMYSLDGLIQHAKNRAAYVK